MKYIIDIPDEYENDYISMSPLVGKEFCYPIRNMNKTYVIPTGLKIEPYTEPDRKTIENETWDLANRIADMSYEDFVSCFEGETEEYVYGLPYQEAKAKYDAWEKQKEEEIHVGDEVFFKGDPHKEKAIVLRLYQPKMYKPVSDVLWADGSVEKTVLVEKLMRTGRHFDEVEELLKKMSENQ